MTKLILETDNDWTKRKIKTVLNTEKELIKRAINKSQVKLDDFEKKFGNLDREKLYGKADDMELIEWEGEIETVERLERNLSSIEEITFEYK
jgi:hypothetical protein